MNKALNILIIPLLLTGSGCAGLWDSCLTGGGNNYYTPSYTPPIKTYEAPKFTAPVNFKPTYTPPRSYSPPAFTPRPTPYIPHR